MDITIPQYPAKLDDLEHVTRIGHGICGEVYRMRHRPTGMELASKVWRTVESLSFLLPPSLHLISLLPIPFIAPSFPPFIPFSSLPSLLSLTHLLLGTAEDDMAA